MDEAAARLVAAFTEWAKARDDVAGLALVGSHARGDATPDSDVDLMVVAESPGRYVEDTTWVETFGAMDDLVVEEWGAVTSLRVQYSNGLEVELGVTSRAWASTDPVDPGTARVVRAGCRILVDRAGLLADLVLSVYRR